MREAYLRVWKYARKYRFRLVVGLFCGMMTATALVPFFQIVQPVLQHVESHDDRVEKGAATDDAVRRPPPPVDRPAAATAHKNAFEKEIARNSKLLTFERIHSAAEPSGLAYHSPARAPSLVAAPATSTPLP